MSSKKGHGDCTRCGARCCRYIVVEIEKPRTKIDREEIRWFLAHKNVLVYVDDDDKTWNVQFTTPCEHLDGEGRCRIYPGRYEICRDHDPATCEASDSESGDTIFFTTADFDRWWRNQQARRRRKRGAEARGKKR
ncbi:MAG: YkgJ family cysteine cluster protein [Planctomycetes bacterium]|nr:YkgJ family cysteine cluster protein [Planctomycetota bacterium]